ncbi:HdeD family acid-resistance protein [Brevibacterium casei]|uniref:HdeD family acid-resistance protein n=1 Tax=Brevibacterium casei TaxID=33889 RepID=UPI00223B691D|nr:DUF308 domain-containing protein [Brevibacterium casei]MCT1550825.1 DUF308 domain-containing protein [Brevibacterium casei]MCT1559098.1 DUF308 domain-containing protein [Brevibacterium casei]MCT2206955.1 DUF308 domain-containing protein [Brevibacterium casei]
MTTSPNSPESSDYPSSDSTPGTGPATSRPDPTDSARSLLTDLGRGVFWVVLLRGILAILFGLLIFIAPEAVAVVVGIWIGAWLVVDGILTIVNANTARKRGLSWGCELVAGIVYIIAGLAIFIAPLTFAIASGIVILWLMAFGMLVRGIFTLASKAFRGWSKLLGVLDIIFAIIVMIVVFTSPASAVTALLWIIGVYVIVFGIFLIVMAFTARSQAKRAMNG